MGDIGAFLALGLLEQQRRPLQVASAHAYPYRGVVGVSCIDARLWRDIPRVVGDPTCVAGWLAWDRAVLAESAGAR